MSIKYDSNKQKLSLVSLELLTSIAKVREFGAKKYCKDNWKSGFKYRRSCDASLRHIFQFLSGETFDSESGLNHLLHAICNLEHLLNDLKNYPENDDRLYNEIKFEDFKDLNPIQNFVPEYKKDFEGIFEEDSDVDLSYISLSLVEEIAKVRYYNYGSEKKLTVSIYCSNAIHKIYKFLYGKTYHESGIYMISHAICDLEDAFLNIRV